jgi:uncharacterized protein YjhX (UPF0386 family)
MRTVFALLCLFPLAAHANPAPVGGPGKTPGPRIVRDAASIVLVDEKVVITDGLIRELPAMCSSCAPMKVHAVGYEGTYQLANRAKKPVSLRVGFPVVEGTVKAGGSYGSLEDFQVRVRGAKAAVSDDPVVSTRLQTRDALLQAGIDAATLAKAESKKLVAPVEGDPDLVDLAGLGTNEAKVHDRVAQIGVSAEQRKLLEATAVAALKDEDDLTIEAKLTWRSFEVSFDPGETVTVKVSYSSIHGWEGADDYRFAYVLTTGSHWAEKIGHCQIVIRPAQDKSAKDYQVLPAGARIDLGEISLEWKDFKPHENVIVRLKAQ